MSNKSEKTEKLATFRIETTAWDEFVSKAKANKETASAILTQTVYDYLDGRQHQHSTNDYSPAIYIAIAPDQQILYIDRAIKTDQWTPPYQIRESNAHIEWIHCSNTALLSPIEDTLIDAFNPPLNFRPKSQIALVKETQPQSPEPLPTHLTERIHSLLKSGISAEGILEALTSLDEPQPQPQPLEISPTHNSTQQQIFEGLMAALGKLTTRIEALENQPISYSTAVSKPVSKPVSKTRKKASESTATDKSKEPIESIEPKQPQNLKLLKGTAALDQIPQQPETTRTLAKRWGISYKNLVRQRQRYEDRPEGFFEYSLEKEEGKFGWAYDPKNQLFYAVTELPQSQLQDDVTPSANPSVEQSSSTPEPLSAKELGARFHNPKTGHTLTGRAVEMAFKRDPDNFAQYCRERDPDGYAWQFDTETKRFVCLG